MLYTKKMFIWRMAILRVFSVRSWYSHSLSHIFPHNVRDCASENICFEKGQNTHNKRSIKTNFFSVLWCHVKIFITNVLLSFKYHHNILSTLPYFPSVMSIIFVMEHCWFWKIFSGVVYSCHRKFSRKIIFQFL